MIRKRYVIIIFIGIIVFGIYDISIQSHNNKDILSYDKSIVKLENIQKDDYLNLNENLEALKESSTWFEETLELLKKEDLESIMFLYSNGVEKDINDLIYEISLCKNLENKKIYNELEDNWYNFCDNFEYAYFNKDNSTEYKKYIKEAIKSINIVIKSINNIKSIKL